MNEIKIFPIGEIIKAEDIKIVLEQKYTERLIGLEGYSHIKILWWMDSCDNPNDRKILLEEKPYKNGPDKLGVFALRAPERPNPIAVSNVEIAYLDIKSGTIGLYYIDANNGSKVIDIKPYIPSIDRIEIFSVPDWCKHWPKSYEESGNFDWNSEFNF